MRCRFGVTVVVRGNDKDDLFWRILQTPSLSYGVNVSVITTECPETVNCAHPKLFLQSIASARSLDFHYTWLLEGDISLTTFQLLKYLQRLNSFPNGPALISQPLIAENTQYSGYMVNVNSWKSEESSHYGAEVSIIEMQAPILESVFFRYFVEQATSVIDMQRALNTSRGHDLMWCGMAAVYAIDVLGDAQRTACAVIFFPVSHEDDKETVKTEEYKQHGLSVIKWMLSSNAPTQIVRAVREKLALTSRLKCLAIGGISDDDGDACCPHLCGVCTSSYSSSNECMSPWVKKMAPPCLSPSQETRNPPCSFSVEEAFSEKSMSKQVIGRLIK